MNGTRFQGLLALTIGTLCMHLCSGLASTSAEIPIQLSFEHLKMQELVQTAGYPLEEHFVTTEDGYVLGLYRIPYGKNNHAKMSSKMQQKRSVKNINLIKNSATPPPPTSPGPPVILQHGLLDSSATFVVNFPHQSLGFILADAGYDVWLRNSRGNAFSRNHTGFQPTGATASFFWDFSFDDMADYDIPAVVQYILSNTESKYTKVAYVGHSQGATQGFAALSSNPALQEKISIFIALAPAIFLGHTSSIPFLILAQLHSDQLFDMLGQHEFLPARKATADIFSEVCTKSPLACTSILTAICGFNPHNINITRLPTYVAYAPSGTSVKNMAHWAQLIRQSGEERKSLFRRYDYGNRCFKTTSVPPFVGTTTDDSTTNTASGIKIADIDTATATSPTTITTPQNCNRRMYGVDIPPSFNLSALTDVSIAIFSGVKDILADPIDVENLIEALPAGALVYSQSEVGFEHMDFTWGLTSAEKIYPRVLRLIDEYL